MLPKPRSQHPSRTTRRSYGLLRCRSLFGSLGNAREFVPVFCQPGNALHFRFVQNQQHEDVIGDVPFALDSVFAGGSEPESGIVVRMSHDNDKWTARILEFLIARFDQLTPDSLALAFRNYCHRPQCRASKFAID